MDRFVVVYDDIFPVAIQDRMTGGKYTSEDFETFCDLLNAQDISNDEALTERNELLQATINDYEEELDTVRHDCRKTVDDLYDQIHSLEDDVDDLNDRIKDLEIELSQLQSQDASA